MCVQISLIKTIALFFGTCIMISVNLECLLTIARKPGKQIQCDESYSEITQPLGNSELDNITFLVLVHFVPCENQRCHRRFQQ